MQNSNACFHLYRLIRVKLSYQPHLTSLYITCHIPLVWLSVAPAVMMLENQLWAVAHLSTESMKSYRECPYRWEGIYFCHINPRPSEKRRINMNICSATVGYIYIKKDLTRYVVIKLRYPLALEGWHNCVQTQGLLHSYREPNRLPFIMVSPRDSNENSAGFFFFFCLNFLFLTETVAGLHFFFQWHEKEAWMVWRVVFAETICVSAPAPSLGVCCFCLSAPYYMVWTPLELLIAGIGIPFSELEKISCLNAKLRG